MPSRSRSKALKLSRQKESKTQEREQEECDERHGREEKGRERRGDSERIRKCKAARKYDEEQEHGGLGSRSKSGYDAHANRRSRQVVERVGQIEQRILTGDPMDDEAQVSNGSSTAGR